MSVLYFVFALVKFLWHVGNIGCTNGKSSETIVAKTCCKLLCSLFSLQIRVIGIMAYFGYIRQLTHVVPNFIEKHSSRSLFKLEGGRPHFIGFKAGLIVL